MTELENILEEFKTKEDVAVKKADEESTIENAVSKELLDEAADAFTQALAPEAKHEESVEFNLEEVEEYKPS